MCISLIGNHLQNIPEYWLKDVASYSLEDMKQQRPTKIKD